MLTKLAIAFAEFTGAAAIEEVVDPAWVEFVDTSLFHEDGANREHSFNYNPGVLKAIFSLVLMNGDRVLPNWLARAKEYAQSYRLLQAAMIMSNGMHPQIGNGAMSQPSRLWEDEALREYKRDVNGDSYNVSPQLIGDAEHPLVEQVSRAMVGDGSGAPAFTSVAFPYAGFYLMRDSWSIADGVSLFFSGSHRSSGHGNADAGGVQLAAYGRSLLVYGGLPTYGLAGTLDWPRELHNYLDEDSSYKTNTILVDGMVQARQETPDRPLGNPWYTSDHFDFAERRYAGGYRLQEHHRPAAGQVDAEVTHTRSVFFVRQAAVWVVVDRLENAGARERTYSQVWNFVQRLDEDDGRGIVHGFGLDDVKVDGAAHRIYTEQPGAPNVSLHHFPGTADLQYQTYFAEEEPYVVPFSGEKRDIFPGWFARNIADRLGAVDVHVAWRGEAQSTAVLVTVIAPSRTTQARVLEAEDRSRDGTSGFLAVLEGGARLGFAAAAGDATLQALGHSVTGRSLLVYLTEDGEQHGMLIDGAGGRELAGPGMATVGDVRVPGGFTWRQTPAGFAPEYGY